MTKLPAITKLIALNIILLACAHSIVVPSSTTVVRAAQCKPDGYVYGENGIIDQLMVCSMAKSSDLDLTPQGEYVKSTARALVEQGLSNKTTILYAKLGGLWTARRLGLAETGWRCELNKTTVSSVIEVDGLALEVVEKVEIPLHRNQHKLAIHKPCKTFDLPLWMCRHSRPIYRTTRTWVNRAFFNLTLSQASDKSKPTIERLSLMLTCPETFKQKITHSPSAMYILSKYMHASSASDSSHPPQSHSTDTNTGGGSTSKGRRLRRKRDHSPTPASVTSSSSSNSNSIASSSASSRISHPVKYASTQDGKGPATPPYHSSVNLIMNQALEVLRSSLNDCVNLIDSDLSLMIDHDSFSQYKFKDHHLTPTPSSSQETMGTGKATGTENECPNERWLRRRLELASETAAIEDNALERDGGGDEPSGGGGEGPNAAGHWKRSQFLLKYPADPNQLLNPYGYYYDNHATDHEMIEDN